MSLKLYNLQIETVAEDLEKLKSWCQYGRGIQVITRDGRPYQLLCSGDVLWQRPTKKLRDLKPGDECLILGVRYRATNFAPGANRYVIDKDWNLVYFSSDLEVDIP